MSLDAWFHIVDLGIQALVAIAVVPAAWKVNRVMRYFPPHRHSNGKIEYSPDFEPGKTELLKT